MVRLQGHLTPLTSPLTAPLTGQAQGRSEPVQQAEAGLAELPRLMGPQRRRLWRGGQEVDFSLTLDEGYRCRVQAYRQLRGDAAALRLLPAQPPTLQAVNAPKGLGQWVQSASGLVLVTGPTGSGKSSTLAALVRHAMAQRPLHLITIEDPIEFIHHDEQGLVTQREVGRHTGTWAQALRAALRQDPDLILVGEMRDLETMRLALSAAETGHLVLATLHTRGAPQAISRIVDAFPAAEKEAVRTQLAESLVAVVSQCLCARRDGQGRVAAHEVLRATPAVRHLLREGRLAQLVSVMQAGQSQGMQTLAQCLEAMVRRGLITPEEAALQGGLPQNAGFSPQPTISHEHSPQDL